MHTPEEAVQWFQEHGLFAETRDWSYGKCVCVWASQETDPQTGITVCHDMIYLYLEEDEWCLSDPTTQVNDTVVLGKLADAVKEAERRIKLKIRPKA